MNMDTPTITASAYTSALVDGNAGLNGMQHFLDKQQRAELQLQNERRMQAMNGLQNALAPFQPAHIGAKPVANTTRIVKVYIADNNDNLPLDKRVIYQGAEQLTDSTDQELYFELPIQNLLAQHNELRAKTLDKKQTERLSKEVFLDPVRVRDLKMVVVTIAQF